MHQIIVFSIPYSDFLFQIVNIFEYILVIELLLVCPVASFYFAILRGLTRINKIVNYVVCGAEFIKSVKLSG